MVFAALARRETDDTFSLLPGHVQLESIVASGSDLE